MYAIRHLDVEDIDDMISKLRSDDAEQVDQVRKFEGYIRSVAGAVKGSDYSRLCVGGNAYASAMCFGRHSIFLTLNLSDVNDLRCYETARHLNVDIDIAMPNHSRPDNVTRIRAATGNPVGNDPVPHIAVYRTPTNPRTCPHTRRHSRLVSPNTHRLHEGLPPVSIV